MNPEPNTTVMIFDVHASESGALAILDDLYSQVKNFHDKSVKWIFIVSTPRYDDTECITVRRFPWVKKNWGFRLFFDMFTTRKIIKTYKPDKVFSLQNKGIPFYKKEQLVYLHLPFILTEHKFSLREDGKVLWLYQNVLSKSIFRSLRKVDCTIVQTQWMKDALISKARVSPNKIVILQPDISNNAIGVFQDKKENRRRLFYPATSFNYKNHKTLLKSLKYIQDRGHTNYELILTIMPNENKYTKSLYAFSKEHNLNVIFGGPISRNEVFEMYAKSVLVFPSYVESFGLPLLEAKLTGTYVIASDCPFSREILNGYSKAYYFEEMDFKKLGEFIVELEAI